ncbi:TraM recognition domain-containing protein, partial [Alcanivorax sp.]|uniref:TraM recognition domain-containing protein n=1 Tax=Alcanivorax sp. TaxID=1872427 RepID=UPI002590E938
YGGGKARPGNVYVHEAAEAINQPTIQLLNKGRGAGFRMTVATQTIADFITRLGDEAQARQVLGNLNNKHILRVMDGETQKYLAESLMPVRIASIETQFRDGHSTEKIDEMTGMVGETLKKEEVDMIPPALFGKLPNLHFFSVLASGQVYKSRIPIVVDR